MQPVDVALKWLQSKPSSLVVADFGCGDARIGALAKQKVHSIDLVARASGVIACNMADTPLSELQRPLFRCCSFGAMCQ